MFVHTGFKKFWCKARHEPSVNCTIRSSSQSKSLLKMCLISPTEAFSQAMINFGPGKGKERSEYRLIQTFMEWKYGIVYTPWCMGIYNSADTHFDFCIMWPIMFSHVCNRHLVTLFLYKWTNLWHTSWACCDPQCFMNTSAIYHAFEANLCVV